MTSIKNISSDDFIIKAIENEVKARIETSYENHKKDFLEKLEKEKAESLASITIWMMKQIDIQSIGDKVVITLRTETK